MENVIVQSSSPKKSIFLYPCWNSYIPHQAAGHYPKTSHGLSERPDTKLQLYKCTFGVLLVTAEHSFSFIVLTLSFVLEEMVLEQSRTAITAAVGKKNS